MSYSQERKLFGTLCILLSIVMLVCNLNVRADAANSKIVIVLDPGHGGYQPGAVKSYNNIKYSESYMTLVIANAAKEELEKTGAFEVHMTRNEDTYLSIPSRTSLAKAVNAKALISFHINSAGSNATGAEVEIQNKNFRPQLNAEGKVLGESILSELNKLGLKNRGTFTRNSENNNRYSDGSLADYYGIIRQTKEYNLLGVIIEHAFISNKSDVYNYLSTDAKLKALGVADAKAIMKYYKVCSTSISQDQQLNQDNKTSNMTSTIEFDSDDPNAYSVILGHENRNNLNMNNAMYPIMGNSQVNEEQLINYYKSKAVFPDYYSFHDPEVKSLNDFVSIYYQEAKAENVRVEVAFAQMIHETNWLKYGGRVKIGQFNFAGLGATDGTNHSGSFASVRLGIRAQIQHLKAYADKNAKVNNLANPLIDNRFKYVKKGCAEYVEWLGQKENPKGLGWATQTGYGNTIRSTINKILQM